MKLFSRKVLLCYGAAFSVLLVIVVHRYAFFGDYLERKPSDNRDAIDDSNNETILDKEPQKDENFAAARGNATASNFTSHDTNVQGKQWGRYVISRNFWEQQTMATNNMFTLVWFCKHWNANVITPYVRNSEFHSIEQKAALPLDLLYDRSQLNDVLEGYRLLPLVPMETFYSNATRSLIVLQLFYNGETMGGNYPYALERFKKDFVFECDGTDHMKTSLAAFVKSLNERTTNPFVAKSFYCVNASHAIHPNELAEIIGIQGDSSASVIITQWRGLSPSDAKRATEWGYLKNFRMFVPELKDAAFPNERVVAVPYSSYVKGNASNFLRSLNVNDGEEFVAVHFRSEKLGTRDGRIKGYFAECWAAVAKILQEDILSEHPKITVLYFADYGSLGSNSCRPNCRGSTITSEAMDKNGLKVSHFDPTKFKAVKDSGFVALVEQCVMSRSQYLLLAGDGSFQSQTRTQFLSQPTAKGGYTVCWDDKPTVDKFK